MRFLPHMIALGALISAPVFAGDKDGDRLPDNADRCPTAAEDRDFYQDNDGCPDADDDADKVCDPVINETGRLAEFAASCKGVDKCPTDAEDIDGYQDEDGCPDPDNDADGIPDKFDKCPMAKEEMDAFEDTDGCPDPDNDQDQVLDSADKCPMAKEDVDQFQDEDGCPDLDNDADGIPDAGDKCPAEPETKNQFEDEDGCPDTAVDPIAPVTKLDVNFVTGTADLTFESRVALDEVVKRMKAYPNVVVGIQVWRVPVGKKVIEDSMVVSTQRQAQSVADYLIAQGIVVERLRIKGMGSWISTDPAEKTLMKPNASKVILTKLEEAYTPAPAPQATPAAP